MPQSTVGYEKLANWALGMDDEAAFVTEVLAGQPEPPAYFAEMKRVNRDGPPASGTMPMPSPADPSLLTTILGDRKNGLIVDIRSPGAFAAGHVPGTINIPPGTSFLTWAGSLLPYDCDFFVIAGSAEAAAVAVRELSLIGLDRMAGWFSAESVAPLAVGRVRQIGATALAAHVQLGDVTVVDVRNQYEWDAGHLPGAIHLPLGQLRARASEIPEGRPIVVQCQGGIRSAIGSSVLLAHGWPRVINLSGGFAEWAREGHAVAQDRD
jgi:hydroxyacylglutathione hydrolase